MTELTRVTLRNRYFLREQIGSGGMADVYQAWDNLRATRMAVKVLRRDLAQSARFNRMFEQEAELLRKLEHPNIVRLYEFDKEGDVIFIVMDWVEGTNLRQAINDHQKPFNLEEVSHILQPVSAALNYAHQNKVFHCDVKPANILLHADGRVLLTDFGVARLASDDTGGGTPPYMSPEQFSGGVINAATDVYALGITIYEMLSGLVPFRGETPNSQGSTLRDKIAWEHLNAQPRPLRQINPGVPPAVENVVNLALSKDTRERYATVLALRDAFEHARLDQGREENSFYSTARDIFNTVMPQSRPAQAHPAPVQPAPVQPPPVKPAASPRQPLQPPASPAQAAQPAAPPRGPYLMGRSGDFASQYIPIPKDELSLGRGANMQVRLQERSVSRVHARLIRTRRGVYLQDENSSVGSMLNGERLQPGVPVLLKSGDIIQLGYYQVFEFRA